MKENTYEKLWVVFIISFIAVFFVFTLLYGEYHRDYLTEGINIIHNRDYTILCELEYGKETRFRIQDGFYTCVYPDYKFNELKTIFIKEELYKKYPCKPTKFFSLSNFWYGRCREWYDKVGR